MIAHFFSKTKPINFVFLGILLVIFHLITIFYHQVTPFTLTDFVLLLRNLVFLLSGFWITNSIINNNTLTNDSGYGLLFYTLLFGYFSMIYSNDTIIIIHFFLLLAFRKIYSLRSDENPKQKLFDSGLWIGMATLFYPLSSVYLLLIIFGMLMFNKINLKYLLLPFIGFIIPFVLINGFYLFFYDSLFKDGLVLITNFSLSSYKNLFFIIPLVYFVLISFWSITSVTSVQSHDRNNFKESWILLISHLILSFLILFASPIKDGAAFIFLFFPLSVVVSNYIQKINKNWIKEVFLFVTIAFFVVVKFVA